MSLSLSVEEIPEDMMYCHLQLKTSIRIQKEVNVIDSVKDSAASTQSIALILNPITDRDWYVTSLTYYCPNTSTLAPSIVIRLKRDSFIEIHS